MKRLKTMRFCGVFLILSFLAGCGNAPASAGISVWIDVPVHDKHFESVQSINIEGHAASKGNIAKVEIWINGVLAANLEGLTKSGDLYQFSHSFTPPGNGDYVIQAVAYGSDGSPSQPDSTRVSVGGGEPVITVTVTMPESIEETTTSTPTTVTETPQSPGAVVEFQANPEKIQAGACTTMTWHAENVSRVIFGGIDQPMDGSYQDCLCKDQRYTLTVIHLDGTEEKKVVEIDVEGVCETPTPEQDTTPPPEPQPMVPADGLNIGCKGSQSLTWLPVNDESGIARYEVRVQRHSGDNNWKNVGGSPFTITSGKTMNLPLECGWTYRWQVRAVDGSGNVGAWSGWSQFIVALT
jgi:hypothetical protein